MIAGFSFLGIMLGVATLIIVMAVMNGFRKELLSKILGLNGHLLVQPLETPLNDWEQVAERLSKARRASRSRPRWSKARRSPRRPSTPPACWCAACARRTWPGCRRSPTTSSRARSKGFDEGQGVAIGRRLADQLSIRSGDNVTLVAPRGAVTAHGHDAAHQGLQGRGRVRDRHVGVRRRLRVHAARRGAALFQSLRRRHRDRGLHRESGPGRPFPPPGHGCGRPRRSSWSIGVSATRPSSMRCRSSATSCS